MAALWIVVSEPSEDSYSFRHVDVAVWRAVRGYLQYFSVDMAAAVRAAGEPLEDSYSFALSIWLLRRELLDNPRCSNYNYLLEVLLHRALC